MWPKTASEIGKLLGISMNPIKNPDSVLNSLSTDSRKVGPGQLFVAIQGDNHDGHDFVEAAFAQGAEVAIVTTSWLKLKPELRQHCL